jgi:hypothetical protein
MKCHVVIVTVVSCYSPWLLCHNGSPGNSDEGEQSAARSCDSTES